MRVPIVLLCPVVGLATVLTACGRPASHASPPSVPPPSSSGPVDRLNRPQHPPQREVVAEPMDPDKRVGPIFLDGATTHVCTGAVLHSAGGNLVITAAHCLAGAAQIAFAPGFAGETAPTDAWTADAVYLDPRW
ncbi:MAG: serine protease, partial [Mycobacterium sp.]|nr:serine protease [Mycobacterium sp.]